MSSLKNNYNGEQPFIMTEPPELPIVTRVIEEARTQIGTWSCASIRSIESELRKMHQNKIDYFVHQLLLFASKPETDNNLKLKIAQLLSSLRSFFLPGVQTSLKQSEELISQIISNIGDGRLSDATKRMFSNLTKDVHIISTVPKRSVRIKSNSVQPGSRSRIEMPRSDTSIGTFSGFNGSKERLI